MADEQDKKVVDDASALIDRLHDAYYAADDAGKWVLEPQIEKAMESWTVARIKLLKQGTLTTPGDLALLEEIKAEIENAADTQATVVAAARLVAFLVRLV